MPGFFRRYDRFLTTSHTGPEADRLDARWSAIIDAHRATLDGRRVLDIASHDGRWSFAAVEAGAAHVTAVEARAELVANAQETFDAYGVERGRYELVQNDIFGFLTRGAHQFDTILCLGFYYHTFRHVELFDLMERTGASSIIIDTEVVPPQPRKDPGKDPRLVHQNPFEVQLLREPYEHESMAVADATSRDGHTIVGRPSRAAVEYIAEHFGFATTEYEWPLLLEGMPEARAVDDYRAGWRTTFHCTRQDSGPARRQDASDGLLR